MVFAYIIMSIPALFPLLPFLLPSLPPLILLRIGTAIVCYMMLSRMAKTDRMLMLLMMMVAKMMLLVLLLLFAVLFRMVPATILVAAPCNNALCMITSGSSSGRSSAMTIVARMR